MSLAVSWDGALKVARDPLFAVALSILLAVLASRIVYRFFRLLLILSAVGLLVWALIRFETAREIGGGIVATILRILLVLVAVVAVLAVVGMFVILVMYLRAESRDDRSLAAILAGAMDRHDDSLDWDLRHLPDRGAPVGASDAALLLAEARDELDAMLQRLVDVLPDFDDADGLGELLRAYFSGLKPALPLIRQIHHGCNRELRHLASELPRHLPRVDRTLQTLAARSTLLPGRADVAEIFGDDGPPYILVRLILLHKDWREWASAAYKCHLATIAVDRYRLQVARLGR